MMNGEDQFGHDDAAVPPRLAEALAALHKERLFVPPQVDEVILARAQAHLAGIARRRARRRALVPWMAAAASVAAAAWVSQTLLHRQQPTPPGSVVAREDVNGDGRVDILDAFVLARQIERTDARQPDLDGDGRVDKRDVDVVAARAVKLERGS
jgi:hypothetical protein